MTDDIFQRLFEQNPRPMWVFDRKTLAFLLVNDAACRHYGWTRDEFLAMTLREIRTPEEFPRLDASLADARRETAPFRRATRHLTKSGQVIEVELDIQHVVHEGRDASLVVVNDVTGVREAERRSRLLVEHSADGISITDTNRTLIYLSPGGARILGVKAEDVIGTSAMTIVKSDDVAGIQPLPTGHTRDVVTRARHADGTWRWIEATTTNLTLDPAVRAFVANFRDVTARVEAERALQEAHHRLEFLLSATLAVTYSAMPSDHGGTFVSASVRDVLGWAPSDFIGTTFWLDHIHPDDRPAVEAGLAELLQTGAHSFEYRFLHGDGSYRWIHDAARVLGDGTTQQPEIVGYMIDISERKRAEESVLRSEANFRTLIERSPSAVLVHRDGTLLYINPAGAALLGYDRADELIGKNVLDLIHPEDQDQIRTKMERTRSAGRTRAQEARVRRRDGSYALLDGEGLLLAFDGEPANVVIGRDVNERNEMFARMAVADRMLSVGTLAAGVAHEINNPLSYVVSNLALLANELPLLLSSDPRQSRLDACGVEQLLVDAREGAARVSAIVRDLRQLSRSDDVTTGPLDVANVLASSIKMAFNEIRHRARINELYAPAPLVQANASRLGQVFLNLLVNAAQAIPEGRADSHEIRVRVQASPDRQQAIVEIEDTGVGIAPSVMGRIFDPFFTTKPIGLGVGLGLSISHQIVRSLGGSITVAASSPHGTTFRIVLPASERQTIESRPAPGVITQTTARVLMIDDEAGVGRSTRMLLSPEYDIHPVTRAREGLELLAGGARFDAIVCDLMMPEMSGIEFYHQLSQSAPAYARRVVFLTGGAFTQQARDFLETVAQPTIDKPFEEHELRAAIERVRSLPADPA